MLQLVRNKSSFIKRIKGFTNLKADDDKYVVSANMKVGAYTIAAQPAYPGRISITHTTVATGTDTLGTITIVGTYNGRAITEVITPVADSTVYSTNYFDTITSITGAGWVIAGGNDTIKVGVSADMKIEVRGLDITFANLVGNMWLNPLAPAVADSTAFKAITGVPIDLAVHDSLYVITDVTGADFEYIIWED